MSKNYNHYEKYLQKAPDQYGEMELAIIEMEVSNALARLSSTIRNNPALMFALGDRLKKDAQPKLAEAQQSQQEKREQEIREKLTDNDDISNLFKG